MKKSKTFLILSIYYALIFMGNAVYISYIGIYFSSIELINSKIGILISISSFIGLLSQPFWGSITDKSNSKNFILQIILLFTAIFTWLIPLSNDNYLFLIISTIIFGFFIYPIGPIGDSIALELSKIENFKFSIIRTFGSFGFALMSLFAGIILSVNIKYLFFIYSTLRFGAFLTLFFLPKVEGHDKKNEKINVFLIFKDFKLVVFYFYVLILSITAGFFQSFHSIYSREAGLSLKFIGIGVMIGSFSQMPFMIFFDKFYKKFKIINLLLISGIVYSIRWFLYIYVHNPFIFIIIWILHGFTFIMLYLCLSHYVDDSVRKELKTRGQVINYLVLASINYILGSFFGGLLSTYIGLKNTFAVCSIICTLMVVFLFLIIKTIPVFLEKKEKNFE
ncbi:MAG: MFS transporter [Spirochaetes bacterium]|nr:MFS transporter [Spirochaetota bacterium]